MKLNNKIKKLTKIDNTLSEEEITAIIALQEKDVSSLRAAYNKYKRSLIKEAKRMTRLNECKTVEGRQNLRLCWTEKSVSKMTDRQKWISDKMNEGWSFSKAQYAYGRMRDGKYYRERNETGIKYEDLIRNYYLDENNNLISRRTNKIKCCIVEPATGRLWYSLALHGDSSSTKKQVASVIYSLYYKVDIPSGYCIHHIDGNKSNNSIDNLQLLTAVEHMSIHCRERNKI